MQFLFTFFEVINQFNLINMREAVFIVETTEYVNIMLDST